MSIVWIILAAVALSFAQAVLFHRRNLKHVTYERHLTDDTVYAGAHTQLVEVIANRKLLPIPWLRAESRISPCILFEKETQDAHEVSGGYYHKSVFFMGPYSRITRRHDVTCTRRGVYDIGSVALTAGDLLSLSTDTRETKTPCRITVYPRLLRADELPQPASRWQGEAIVKRWIMPDPFLMAGIRDYRDGDAMRDIHWRATARTGHLEVKVRDFTAETRMFVVLNMQTSEAQWADPGADEAEFLEFGIRVAATLMARAIASGAEAGFASNACLTGKRGSGEAVWVPARGGTSQRETLLTAAAMLELHREINFPTLMDQLTSLSGEDILIISAYESNLIREKMDALRGAGNSASLYVIRKEDIR